MQHEREEISAPDGTKLVVESWTPKSPSFAVCMVHGNAEHVGRYAHVAEAIAAAGGVAFGMDRRGQGESGGPPGHVDAFEVFASDLRHLLLQRAEKIPLFILGHSAGGLVTLVYLLDHADDVPLRGVILSNPLIALAMKVNPVTAFFGKVAASVAPELTVASNIPASHVSRDPQVVAAYEADERRVPKVSTRWFVAMNEAAARVEAEAAKIEVPLLWAVGTGDKICDHTASERVFATLKDPKGNDQTLKSFEGYYHELVNEPEPDRTAVIEAMVAWIKERAS